MKQIFILALMFVGLTAYSQTKTITIGNATAGITESDIGSQIANSLTNIKAGIFNVLDYGAVPNDANSDSAAIADAIAAMTVGDALYFPDGVYLTTGGHSFTVDSIFIYSQSNRATIKLLAPAASYSVFILNDVDNARIDGLNFDLSNIDNYGIRPYNGCSDLIITNCNFKGYGNNGYAYIGFRNTARAKVNNCTFTGGTTSDQKGINGYDSASEIEISNCHFYSIYSGIAFAADIGMCRNIKVDNCTFRNMGPVGVRLDSVRNAMVTNCIIDSTTTARTSGGCGIEARLGSRNVIFANNVVTGGGAISAFNSFDVNISHNTIINSNVAGVEVNWSTGVGEDLDPYIPDSWNIIVSENIIRGTWYQTVDGAASGIFWQGARGSIDGNIIENSMGSGINVQSSRDVTITRNKIKNAGYYGNITGTPGYYWGIRLGYDTDTLWIVRNVFIEDNIIQDDSSFLAGGGILVDNPQADSIYIGDNAFDSRITTQIEVEDGAKVYYTGSLYASVNSGTVGTSLTPSAPIIYYNESGASDLSANPQITAGYNGQTLTIIGSSGTNTLTLDDGDGLALTGQCVLGSGDTITLIYNSTLALWIETSRANN